MLRPLRQPIPPAPPRTGVTPESVGSHDQAMAWFAAERPNLVAAVSAARGAMGQLGWQQALSMQQFFQWQGHIHD